MLSPGPATPCTPLRQRQRQGQRDRQRERKKERQTERLSLLYFEYEERGGRPATVDSAPHADAEDLTSRGKGLPTWFKDEGLGLRVEGGGLRVEG